jgi:hypothetical protein
MTWGELRYFKHFLPPGYSRWSPPSASDGDLDMETVVGALKRGHWRSWPAHEQDAVVISAIATG